MPDPVPGPQQPLLYDPEFLPLFDFASPEFAAARAALLEGDDALPINDAQAVQAFERGFAAVRARLSEAWTAQQNAEADQRALVEQQRAAELAARAADEAAERRELEKKRPKMPAISRGTAIAYDSRPPLSSFASKRLEKFEHVPLWYFTQEAGLEAASESTASITNPSDTITFTRSAGNSVSVQSETGTRASARQKKDRDLTFTELGQAQMPFLRALAEHHWSQDVITMWSDFIVAIIDHDFRFIQPIPLHEAALMFFLDKT